MLNSRDNWNLRKSAMTAAFTSPPRVLWSLENDSIRDAGGRLVGDQNHKPLTQSFEDQPKTRKQKWTRK